MAVNHNKHCTTALSKNIYLLIKKTSLANQHYKKRNPSPAPPWPQGMVESFSGTSFLLLYKETKRTLTT